MTILVAVDPDGHGRAVLDLARMLARSADGDLMLCAVLPSPWPPSLARVDAEYQAELRAAAHRVLERARERVGEAELLVHHAHSVAGGLLEVAEERDASLIAAAGLTRLGMLEEAVELLDESFMLPAPGQGVLALQIRADDQKTDFTPERIAIEATGG